MSKYKKGQSGNPNGRPKGSGVSGKIREAIIEKAPELLQVVVDRAIKEGDSQSALALLAKVVPNLKASSEPVQFKLETDQGLSVTGESVIRAMGDGSLPIDSGSQILSGLGTLKKLIEMDDLVERIEQLEQRDDHTKNTSS